MTTDMYSGIWEMVQMHLKLRYSFEQLAHLDFILTLLIVPTGLKLPQNLLSSSGWQSKHNTPIEGFWWWKCQGEGHSIHKAIFIGKAEGLFNQIMNFTCLYL
jgi:hypothetical protein